MDDAKYSRLYREEKEAFGLKPWECLPMHAVESCREHEPHHGFERAAKLRAELLAADPHRYD